MDYPLQLGPIQSIQDLNQAQKPLSQQEQIRQQLLRLMGPTSAAHEAALDASDEEKRTPSLAASGAGPSGIRIGEGPGGWAVSLGDMVGGFAQQAKNRAAKEAAARSNAALAAQAQGPLSDLLNLYSDQPKKPAKAVPQGTPMTNTFPDTSGDPGGSPMGL